MIPKFFLWKGMEGGRSHLARREVVSKPLKLRVLGIDNLILHNEALLGSSCGGSSWSVMLCGIRSS